MNDTNTPENEVTETETPETEAEPTPSKKQGKPATMEERMLEMLLRERHGELLDKALAEGKTIRGAWNYVVSVMKNAYIAEHGRVNGGCCGNADVVVAIAERYLREFPEGTVEPEVSHNPKKSAQKSDAESVKKKVVATAKAAANAAKSEAKRKAKKIAEAVGAQQLFFNI